MYYRKTNHQTQFLIRCGQLLELFKSHPEMTVASAAELLGCSTVAARGYIKALNRPGKNRRIYVKRWIRNKAGRPTAVWAAGSQRNAQRPSPLLRSRTDKFRDVEAEG